MIGTSVHRKIFTLDRIININSVLIRIAINRKVRIFLRSIFEPLTFADSETLDISFTERIYVFGLFTESKIMYPCRQPRKSYQIIFAFFKNRFVYVVVYLRSFNGFSVTSNCDFRQLTVKDKPITRSVVTLI